MKAKLLLSAALMPLTVTMPAVAQEVADASRVRMEEIIVTGEIAMRNRAPDANPVLSYDLDYFQRFEPVSVGEMLKRVPGVTFTSDVLEFDGVSMRGLPPGYTQILINGRRAPGGESDRSFFVDRIPAELVERIEIIRAPRADQPSEGIGGSLNVILKEGAKLEGGFAKGGALINEDGKIRPSAALAYAGSVGDTSLWGALNYQGRRNPKKKRSERFGGDFGALDNIELQDDTRDGTDISANTEMTHRFDGGRLRLSGLFVNTDRDEDEVSSTFEAGTNGALTPDGVEVQAERIRQKTYDFSADGKVALGKGDLDLNLGWSGYREDTRADVSEGDEAADVELAERELLDIKDDEVGAGIAYSFGLGSLKAKLGVDGLRKVRDFSLLSFEMDDGELEDETAPGAVHKVKETRIDPFLRLTAESSPTLKMDAGLRIETTRRRVASDAGVQKMSRENYNPSAHLTFQPTKEDQFRLSAAHTVRRPGYDLIVPFVQEEEPADEDDLQGNPFLKDEKSWGIDAGYERRLGRLGVVGVNLFYRHIDDLIDLVDTGATASEGGNVYEPRNIGRGKTWGVEIDFSSPLSAIGLPDTGLFFNYTWLDSKVRDPLTGHNRPFTNQPSNVYNVGLIHNVEPWGVTFGASLYDRDKGYEFALDEEVEVDYQPDLEAFIEKRFGQRVVLRFAAMNLLDKKKTERFRTFDGDSVEEILQARINRDVDESELERERSGILFQVTLRAAF